MADPGFPIRGVHPWGGVDLRCRHFSVKMYAKMKKLGPIGEGVCPARPPDLPMVLYGQFMKSIFHTIDVYLSLVRSPAFNGHFVLNKRVVLQNRFTIAWSLASHCI